MAYDYQPQPFNQASGYFAEAAKNATPSPESLDRAAARLRSRTDQAARATQQETTDSFAGRGLGTSGMYRAAQQRNRAASQGTYASGLAQLEDDYTKRLQESSQYLTAAGTGLANSGYQQGQLQGQAEELRQGQGALDLKGQELQNTRQTDFGKNLIDSLLALSQSSYADPTTGIRDNNWAQEMQKLRNQIAAYFGLGGEHTVEIPQLA